jgi:hypothetical protein
MESVKQRVHIESTIVSYYANRPSSNLVIAGRQQVTRDWWEDDGRKYDLFSSALVIQEISGGNVEAAQKRLSAIADIPLLSINQAMRSLAKHLVQKRVIPAEYPEDALHISIASVHGMDYLLTWNFHHINNAVLRSRIATTVEAMGYICPSICSPEELSEFQYGN